VSSRAAASSAFRLVSEFVAFLHSTREFVSGPNVFTYAARTPAHGILIPLHLPRAPNTSPTEPSADAEWVISGNSAARFRDSHVDTQYCPCRYPTSTHASHGEGLTLLSTHIAKSRFDTPLPIQMCRFSFQISGVASHSPRSASIKVSSSENSSEVTIPAKRSHAPRPARESPTPAARRHLQRNSCNDTARPFILPRKPAKIRFDFDIHRSRNDKR